jgi:hypothetical protein
MLSRIRHRYLTGEVAFLAGLGVLLIGLSVAICIGALNQRHAAAPVARQASVLPALPPARTDDAESGQNSLDETRPEPTTPAPVATPAERNDRPISRPAPPRVAETAPLPPARPAEIDSRPNPPAPIPRPERFAAIGDARSHGFSPAARYDQFTAVYDLTAHTVFLPNGAKLEAHSGLGEMLDDPRYVSEKDRGPTPPHVYELSLRESVFHGVQALRLNPIGADGMYGRDGLLAHPYMLGPNVDSNGCVSFKDYDAFLQAFQIGQVKRLVVVARLD